MNKLQKVFGWKELRAIAGNKGSNIFWLGLISLLALLVLGFAESIELFLKEKMDNPHVRLVEVNWPEACTTMDSGVVKFRDLTTNRYGNAIASVEGVVKGNDYFLSRDGKLKYGSIGFVNNQTDILYDLTKSEPSEFITPFHANTLLEDSSAIGLHSFTAKEGIIVSRSFLRRLELPDDAKAIDIHVACDRKPLTLPVSAILKNLPSEVDLIMHDQLWKGILGSKESSTLTKKEWNHRISESLEEYFLIPNDVWENSTNETKRNFKEQRRAPVYSGGYVVQKVRRKKVPNDWKQYAWVNPSTVLKMLATKVQGETIARPPSVISVMFESIDSVRVFADWIQNDPKFIQAVCPTDSKAVQNECAIQNQAALKVDLSKIKSKELFSLFNDIAELLRYFLMAAASMLLIMRCNALFQLHIEKNRASLGTLKAFGLSNNRIIGLYAGIAVLMLLGAFVISMAALAALGPVSVEFAKSVLSIRPEDATDLTYHNMDLAQGFVAFVLLPIAFVSYRIRKLLQLSPGALVFGRKSTSS